MASACWVFLPAPKLLNNPWCRAEIDDEESMGTGEGDSWVVVSRRRRDSVGAAAQHETEDVGHVAPRRERDGGRTSSSSGVARSQGRTAAGRFSPWELAGVRPSATPPATLLALLPGLQDEVRRSAFHRNLRAAMVTAEGQFAEAVAAAAAAAPPLLAAAASAAETADRPSGRGRVVAPAAASCATIPTSTTAAAAAAAASAWSWREGVQELVVYGLGSLGCGLNPRYQLALAKLLEAALPGLASPPAAFDPAFGPGDLDALRTLGWSSGSNDGNGGGGSTHGGGSTNSGGRGASPAAAGGDSECSTSSESGGASRGSTGTRRAARPTLFYMPHCEAELTDALLAANWGRGQLSRIAVIGNSFSTYAERWSLPTCSRSGMRRPHRMLALCAAPPGVMLELRAADAGFPVASAFNDMSVHLFPGWHDSLDAIAGDGSDG